MAREKRATWLSNPQVRLMIIGGFLLPLGVVCILLGWYGASHTPYSFEQTSYVISGGLLGLGLVFAGGFLYFGGWVSRLVESARVENDRLIAAIEKLAAGGAGVGAPRASANGSAAAVGGLVATRTGTLLHRPDCAVVASRDDVRQITADEQGDMQPCRLCNPLEQDVLTV
jgi:hypothetical protein